MRRRLDAVVAAMKANGSWDVVRPADGAFADMGAFGTKTMAFEQWLRWVFVPNVEALIASDGPWPASSSVAVQAARESGWGGYDQGNEVGEPLRAFDALFAPELDEASRDALVAAGRASEAIAEAERAGTPSAHNWLGWRLIGDASTLPQAIEHFRAAVRARPSWGRAHENLARALENADRDDEWYEQFEAALGCSDEFDRAYCHERIAAYQARRGWLRNALGSARAALREDDRAGGGARRALHVEAVAWIEQQLRAAGVEPPPQSHSGKGAWARACELELPPGFGARNELGEPLADDVIEVERLIRAERWADAVAQLQLLRGGGKLFDAVGFAARGAQLAWKAGRHDDAIAIQELVVEAYEWYGSGASSGGEGMARQLDTDRARARLLEWRAR